MAQGKATYGDNRSLHFDHEPPLQEHERINHLALMDENRIQLLCFDCHNAKTKRQSRA
jgi:5-methylcytosine-specific restriction endonuclease McrA